MNLFFQKSREIDDSTGKYHVYRAVVGENPAFWYRWRNVENKEDLHNKIFIRKEDNQWVIYRILPVDNTPEINLSRSYIIRDKSLLLSYQPEIVSYLCSSILRHGAAIDGSDTGIGKTYSALAVCRELGFSPGIVCRKAGIYSWKTACLYMGIKPLFIVNWELAKSDKFNYSRRDRDEWSGHYTYQWILPKNILLIFDECHMANHELSQNSSLYRASKGHVSLSLSATPADRIIRLKALFHVLNIMNEDEFSEYIKNFGFIKFKGEYESLSEKEDLIKANKLLYPCRGYRLSYSSPEVKKIFPAVRYIVDVLTLPEINVRKQNKLYNLMINKVSRYRELGKNAEALVADLRYRQAAELLKADMIIDLAVEYLYEGKSVCIFVNFLDTLDYLSKKMKTKSIIYGSQKNRQKIINNFQKNNTRIIILMSDAGGQSISLHDLYGNHPRISLISPSYNAVTLHQVCGRIYRAGSKSTPIIKLLYAAGTVEEKVSKNVLAKIDNISALNDGDLLEPDLLRIGFKR